MCMCTCIYYRNNIQSRFQCISLISLRNTAYKKGNPCTASHFHTFFKTLKFHHGCLEVCFNHNVDLCVISVYLLIYVFVSSIWQHYKVSYNLATLHLMEPNHLIFYPKFWYSIPLYVKNWQFQRCQKQCKWSENEDDNKKLRQLQKIAQKQAGAELCQAQVRLSWLLTCLKLS